MTIRLGIAFTPYQPPESLRTLVTTAEEAGLDELWIWEDAFKQSGLASAGPALAWSERLRVGIGLMPAPFRNVGLTAMEVATLGRLFPDRFVAGVGHGVQSWMAQAGVKASSPMTLLREYLLALRRLLDGETLTEQGRYVRLDQVRLDWPPSPRPALMAGGFGPKTLQLAAELGDGVLLAGEWRPEQFAESIRLARQARERAGLDPATMEVVLGVSAAIGAGARDRIARTNAAAGGSSDPDLGITGDATAFAETFGQLAEMGVTAVTVAPTMGEPDLDGLLHFLGSEVRPLLSRGSGASGTGVDT